jgi:Gpi18-like mannosyltransferase
MVNWKHLGFASVVTLIPTLLIWLIFFLRPESLWGIPLPQNGMATIVANFDGPLYIIAAKTLYNPQLISTMYEIPLPTEYYAAHFPMFPILIRLFSPLFGYPYSMLFVTLMTSILAVYAFMKLISGYVSKNNLYWIAFAFAVFPARWLAVRSVGSPEPLFLAAIIASLYFFQNKKYFWAGVFGLIAQLTKSPGILLFIAYLVMIAVLEFKKLSTLHLGQWLKTTHITRYLPILLIPAGLVATFIFYKVQLNDFWAYFNSGDNIHLLFPPFQIFNYSLSWVGSFWLEEIILIYLFVVYGLLTLIKMKEEVLFWFAGIFIVTLLFVTHRDIARYTLPIVPLMYVAFSELMVKKEFKITLLVILLPILLYSIVFISQNTMPISDWSAFL